MIKYLSTTIATMTTTTTHLEFYFALSYTIFFLSTLFGSSSLFGDDDQQLFLFDRICRRITFALSFSLVFYVCGLFPFAKVISMYQIFLFFLYCSNSFYYPIFVNFINWQLVAHFRIITFSSYLIFNFQIYLWWVNLFSF